MRTVQVITIAVVMIISSTAFAQQGGTDNREKLQFALKAGLNYSNAYNSRSEEFNSDAKFGFAGGAVIRIPISEYVGVQPEVLVSQKGFKGEGMLLGSRYHFNRTTTYLDIPLQLALKPSEFITVVAGPQYSYLLKQKDVFTSSFISYLQEQEIENDNIRKNIFGFVAGMDINLRHIVLGSRIGWDITKNHGDRTSSTPRYKNMWLQATIGYTFYK